MATAQSDSHYFGSKDELIQFWIVQMLGWLGYSGLVFLSVISPNLANADITPQLLHLLIETVSGFLLSLLIWQAIRNIAYRNIRHVFVVSMGLSLLLATIWTTTKLITHRILVLDIPWNDWTVGEFGSWYLFSAATLIAWAALYLVILYNKKLRDEHEKALRAETLARESQLRMLRYQLNPHFMFNTMNGISTLILKRDHNNALEMLDQLCQFFRYSIYSDPLENTSLKQELKVLNLYLDIEKSRFGERLKFQTIVTEEAGKAEVPNLLLQPLAENAIKHTVSATQDQVEIILNAWIDGDDLVLCLSDNGPGLKNSKYIEDKDKTGIGLSNTDNRLKALYGDRYSLLLSESHPKGLEVTIRIPSRPVSTNE